MKVYEVYLRCEGMTMLYGYSDNKDLITKFISSRNSRLFDVAKVKMKKKTFEEFQKNYKNREIGTEKINIKGKDGTTKYIEVAMTTDEYIGIIRMKNQLLYKDIFTYVKIDPKLFNDKYKRVLNDILYTYVYNCQVLEYGLDECFSIDMLNLLISSYDYAIIGKEAI